MDTEIIRPLDYSGGSYGLTDYAKSYDTDVATYGYRTASNPSVEWTWTWPSIGGSGWAVPIDQTHWSLAILQGKIETIGFDATYQWALFSTVDEINWITVLDYNSSNVSPTYYQYSIPKPYSKNLSIIHFRLMTKIIGGPRPTLTIRVYDVQILSTITPLIRSHKESVG